jgi:hypothetical protein
MKKERKTSKKQLRRRQENYNYLMDTLKGWDGYSLLEFYIESKTGNHLDIDKIPCWILEAFDELTEVINNIQRNRLTLSPNGSLEEREFSKSMKYYHITSPENVENVLKNGLKANEQGEIFIFQYAKITMNGVVNFADDCIAYNQVFLEKYARIEIDPEGISVPLINDNVAESTNECQWIVKQERINPEYLRLDVIKENGYIPCFQLN